MNFLQHLRNYFTPSPARCSDTGIESHYDTMYASFNSGLSRMSLKHTYPSASTRFPALRATSTMFSWSPATPR